MALLRLPERLRGDLKAPLGPIYTDLDRLLRESDVPLIAVGDIVTYHLEEAGRSPDVALVDGRSEREAVDDAVDRALAGADVTVGNPPGALTEELLVAIRDSLDASTPIRIRVDGEEDLAALPAIVAAPIGASVVYGQPGEGMVLVRVTAEAKRRARSIVERMDGDPERALSLLE